MNRRNSFTSNFNDKLKFIIKLILFGGMLLCYMNYVLPQYDGGYNSSLVDKAARIESIDGPKIVLLGNSNLSFGIDSSLIEEQMGMSVVNMGLHGGAGNVFHEEMGKLNVCEGDIYVVCHTGYSDSDVIQDPMIVWTSIENHYDLWKLLRGKDIRPMIMEFPTYLKKSLDLFASGTGNIDGGYVYSRSAFNEYGDIALPREETFEFTEDIVVPGINDITVNRLNELNRYLEARGATLLVAAYPVANGIFTADAQEFLDFQENLATQLECPVISNFVDYMFDYSYFFDTNVHLNSAGAKLRTEQLIADLKAWQNAESKSKDATFENDMYQDILSDVMLSHITDIKEYLETLNGGRNRYSIFLSADIETAEGLNETVFNLFREAGLAADMQDTINYLAVIEGEKFVEKSGYGSMELYGITADQKVSYKMIHTEQNKCSVILNGLEYSRQGEGINMVIYSNETGRVLDSINLNIYSDELAIVR